MATAVIGAGPAGLLFSVTSRLLHRNAGGAAADWPILLFDKRAVYERRHRLRTTPAAFRAIKSAVRDPRFDELVASLEQCGFSPTVNALEERLSALAAELGMRKERLQIGTGEGETDLARLRDRLQREERISPATRLTIVGADSVHSAVREQVRGDRAPIEETHQIVGRLRLGGTSLPERLPIADQYRLSKALGSLIDYRFNPNGYAEVDLFLNWESFGRLEALGASPRTPVALTAAVVKELEAPLLDRLIEYLRSGLSREPCEVLLNSTFRLEHRHMDRVVFELPEGNATVFLVGDAAASLPFFRGMSCLARCALSLARVHSDLALASSRSAEAQEARQLAERYQCEATAIIRSEVETVRARARLVRSGREFVRLSSLVPFPLQTWLFTLPESRGEHSPLTPGVLFNAVVAGAALLIVLGGILRGDSGLLDGWWWLAGFGMVVGGLTYRGALALEPGSERRVRRVWRMQFAVLWIVGTAITAVASIRAGGPTHVEGAVAWLLLAIPFVGGIYLFDMLNRRRFERARVDEEEEALRT